MRILPFRSRHTQGFTLLELMVTVAVAGILAVLAVPNFNAFIDRQQIKTAAHAFLMDLTYARSEALKRNSDVQVAASGGDWANGWSVTNAAGDTLKVRDAQEMAKIAFPSFDTATVTYRRNGRITETPSGGAERFEFIVCDKAGSDEVPKRIVILDLSGRPNLTLEGNCGS